MPANNLILLLGGSGYLGSAFRARLDQLGLPYQNLSRRDRDYTQPAVLLGVLRQLRPAFLINCAGYTGQPNVDACETHKTECLLGNTALPGIIRAACETTGVPWGHVSSGCIYAGQRPDGTGFREDDTPNFTFRQNNCSFYSGCKALGEELLADARQCYIWRVRIPFSDRDHPRNYLTKLMRYDRLLDARNSLSQLDEAVAAAIQCWQDHLPFGVYHLTNPGAVTTREVVDLIKERGVTKNTFRFFANEEEFLRLAAKTPRSNCVLDTTKLAQAGIRLTEVHAAIDQALRNWQPA